MEFILDILKYASAIFVFCISGVTIILSLRSQRFQWGISPKGPSAPALLMRAWLLFGGTYGMWWSSVRLGLDSHLLTDRSRAVTLLAFVTNNVGRIVIHLLLIVVFAFFAISISRMNRSKERGSANAFRVTGIFLAFIVIFANLFVLLRYLFRF
jgi:hypothetical protein